MSVEVVMPQMGESITEGTVSKWFKKVGEKVEKDEMILEISTDKVDAEVFSPSAGILLEIRTEEGETVEVGTAVGIVGEESETAAEIQSPKSENKSSNETATVEEPKIQEIEQSAHIEEVQSAIEDSSNPEISENSVNAENATEVVMPQMGESITEGTVLKWLKAVGDKVEKDETILEISTDKVDAEVPSPVAGTLIEILTAEGETVEVGAVVGLVGSEGGASVSSSKSRTESSAAQTLTTQQTTKTTASAQTINPAKTDENREETEGRSYDYQRPESSEKGQSNGKSNGDMSLEDLRKTKSSPLVRNIAKEHGVDISRIEGSGLSGRVTKKDILSFIETGAALRPQDLLRKTPSAIPQTVSQPQVQSATKTSFSIATTPAGADRVEPMSLMRKKIAEHMTFSKQTSAHVTSVYEFDMTNVAKFRDKNKAEFQSRYGTKLTFMPFIFQAVTQALRQFPIVNSQVSGDQITYKADINLGIAVALDWGLIVPVIKRADQLSLSGLALAANDLADRARTKKLMPDEVAGGTFTITNPGVFGGLFGTPIINQPQVAILCVGTIEKRPKVITTADGDDVIAVRSMAYFALTYDHRVVDGADAEKFLSFMKIYLETSQFNL